MELIIGLFGAWWIAVGVLILAVWLIVGTALDRARDSSSAMWMAVVASGIVLVGMQGWQPVWLAVSGTEFWTWAAGYVALGLVYSWVVEFFFAVRRAKALYSERWTKHIEQNRHLREYLADPSAADPNTAEKAVDAVREFMGYQGRSSGVIHLDWTRNPLAIEPKINRRGLIDNITAWTLLWPAYAVSLVFGDLLTQVFEFVVDAMSKLSGQFVKWVFKDVFKV